MLKFYVDLAGHERVKDAGRATTCRRKFKAPSLQTKSLRKDGPAKNMGFNRKKV